MFELKGWLRLAIYVSVKNGSARRFGSDCQCLPKFANFAGRVARRWVGLGNDVSARKALAQR